MAMQLSDLSVGQRVMWNGDLRTFFGDAKHAPRISTIEYIDTRGTDNMPVLLDCPAWVTLDSLSPLPATED